jgi:tetraacyldisaccharide 4'-kinase
MAGKGTQTPPYWYDGSPVPWAMRLLAPLYAGVTALRRRAYRRGWRKRYALRCRSSWSATSPPAAPARRR